MCTAATGKLMYKLPIKSCLPITTQNGYASWHFLICSERAHKQTAGEAVKTHTTRLSDHQLGRTDWQVSASGSSQSAVLAALDATEVQDCFSAQTAQIVPAAAQQQVCCPSEVPSAPTPV